MSLANGDYSDWLSRNAEAAWTGLGESPGQPRRIDVSILVKTVERPRSREGRVVLDVSTEKGSALGRAFVFSREWYPGRPAGTTPQFSHYGATLWRVLSAMERRGDTNPLRLQVLQAVRMVNRAGEPLTVLLKFIIAPEYTLSGGQLESI
ncbi:MAG TPA: hypothetical protein VKU87_06940, partial [Thermomicrobiaceae bacterium]|nr:hypothetical protein [Thermomicrobiaceae bacterium]